MKKIMFNDRYGLTKAVLEGRKTMTRRIVPDSLFEKWRQNESHQYMTYEEMCMWFLLHSPFKIGDVLAIAQSYYDICHQVSSYELQRFRDNVKCNYKTNFIHELAGFKNKMFVRADLMPHQIRITNIRVEKLKDITEKDCFKEGINTLVKGKIGVGNGYGWDVESDAYDRETFFTPKGAFACLINYISGKGTWAKNPLVWVYEFELIR